jgi:hypothetical protein
MLIQIIKPKTITLAGTATLYKKGDFVDLPNTRLARQWIANNEARPFNLDDTIKADDVGIVSRCGLNLPYKMPFTQADIVSPVYPRTVVVNTKESLKRLPKIIKNIGRLAIMLDMLERFDVIVALANFKQRALHVAPNEHERTLSIVGDLRIPYYSNDVFAVRDNKAGRKFCEVLEDELQYGEQLALLRTVYQSPSLFYYLPTEWVK